MEVKSLNQYIVKNHRHVTSFDLRAELLFKALINNKFNDLDIVVKQNGTFYRGYSKDKLNISTDLIDPDIVNLEISRNSFYDILPESFAHNYRERDLKDDPIQEFKNRKKEEKEARHFFNPLENEFFRFRYEIENYESDFFSKLNSNGIVDIIKIVLAIEDKIPDHLVIKIYYALLKHNQNKEQSIDGIVEILKSLLNENVTYTISNIELNNKHNDVSSINDMILGINTTLESSQKIFLKKYNFYIGPLSDSNEIEDYYENHEIEIFLSTFFSLFLPIHIQYGFHILLNQADEKFKMDNSKFKSRLGISTVL